MKVIIIIPAFNEADNLPGLLMDIRQKCPHYDVIVINDCSTDKTEEVCINFSVNHINLPVNLGIGGAVQCGYKYAYYNGYDIAVQVDGDRQHDPLFIRLLVEKLQEGNNLCIGSRFIIKNYFCSSKTRRCGIIILSVLIRVFSKHIITDPTSGFRACDRKAMEYFTEYYPQDYPEPETIVALLKNKFAVTEVPVIMNERQEGKSSITKIKSIYYMLKVSLAIIISSFSRR